MPDRIKWQQFTLWVFLLLYHYLISMVYFIAMLRGYRCNFSIYLWKTRIHLWKKLRK